MVSEIGQQSTGEKIAGIVSVWNFGLPGYHSIYHGGDKRL
jgi:hypothetical protein